MYSASGHPWDTIAIVRWPDYNIIHVQCNFNMSSPLWDNILAAYRFAIWLLRHGCIIVQTCMLQFFNAKKT